jgi:ketosteroid isomerase-like protein
VRDGRITEGRTICDLGSLFIAAGAVPAMAG